MNRVKLTQVADQNENSEISQLVGERKKKEKDDLLKVFVELDTDSTTDLAGGS